METSTQQTPLIQTITTQAYFNSVTLTYIGILNWHHPSGRTIALGLTQPLREMSTRNISWGVKEAGA